MTVMISDCARPWEGTCVTLWLTLSTASSTLHITRRLQELVRQCRCWCWRLGMKQQHRCDKCGRGIKGLVPLPELPLLLGGFRRTLSGGKSGCAAPIGGTGSKCHTCR